MLLFLKLVNLETLEEQTGASLISTKLTVSTSNINMSVEEVETKVIRFERLSRILARSQSSPSFIKKSFEEWTNFSQESLEELKWVQFGTTDSRKFDKWRVLVFKEASFSWALLSHTKQRERMVLFRQCFKNAAPLVLNGWQQHLNHFWNSVMSLNRGEGLTLFLFKRQSKGGTTWPKIQAN